MENGTMSMPVDPIANMSANTKYRLGCDGLNAKIAVSGISRPAPAKLANTVFLSTRVAHFLAETLATAAQQPSSMPSRWQRPAPSLRAG